MSETIDAARKLITDRLSELEVEADQLQRALKEMGDDSRRRPTAPKSRRKPAARKSRSGSRAKRGQRREQLLAAIKAKPGYRPAQLAGELGVAAGQVSALLAKARAENLVVKKGAGYELKR